MVFNAEPIGIEKDISCYGNVDILVKSDPNEVKYKIKFMMVVLTLIT